MSHVKIICLASLAVGVLAICLYDFHNVILAKVAVVFQLISNLIHRNYSPGTVKPIDEILQSKSDDVLLTREQLEHYGSSGGNGRLYLSILGQIFDVTKGRKHYGGGGAYNFFSGRDASRAFVTGDFTESGLTDDVLDLSSQQLRGLKKWSNFFEKEYKYVGKLIGRYYDEQGYNTPYLEQVEKMIEDAEMKERDNHAEKLKYPPCNTEWNAKEGARVWCSNKSGGISREWIGVPRKLYLVGSTTPRCVCIRHPNESQSEGPSLDDPRLEEYPGCNKDSISCSVKT